MSKPDDSSNRPQGPKRFAQILALVVLVFVATGVLPPHVIPVLEGYMEHHPEATSI